jgi:hypothetical protein
MSGRAALIAIGEFTEQQFSDINAVRQGLGVHELESREIVFIGRYIFTSRDKDGYTIDDMVAQIESALSSASMVFASPKMTAMSNPNARPDGYGDHVDDRKPSTRKAPPKRGLSTG